MKSGAVAAAGSGIVAENGIAHVVVVVRSQIARLRVGTEVHDPEVGQRVRTNGMSYCAEEGDAASIGAEGKIADAHGDGCEFLCGSAR